MLPKFDNSGISMRKVCKDYKDLTRKNDIFEGPSWLKPKVAIDPQNFLTFSFNDTAVKC